MKSILQNQKLQQHKTKGTTNSSPSPRKISIILRLSNVTPFSQFSVGFCSSFIRLIFPLGFIFPMLKVGVSNNCHAIFDNTIIVTRERAVENPSAIEDILNSRTELYYKRNVQRVCLKFPKSI